MLCGKNKHKASLLIEILIATAIIASIFPVMPTLLKQAADIFLSLYDKRIAAQRIISVESLLESPLFYCGYAMPCDAAEYKSTFNNTSEPFSWDGAISVTDYGGRKNAALRIVYGKRENLRVASKFNFSEGISETIYLSGKVNSDNLKASSANFPSKVQNYVLFASMSRAAVPLPVRKISSNGITISGSIYKNFVIPAQDTLYLLCALKLYAQDGKLYSNDYRTTGIQPRLDGIEDLRFFLDDTHKTLTTYTLVRGETENQKAELVLTDFEEDSKNTQFLKEWRAKVSKTRLYASKRTWRLPNCRSGKNYLPDTAGL